MSKFVDKNALFDIVMEVRDGNISKQTGLKKIFTLLLSLNGRVGVIDGEVVFNPNKYAYLDYVDTYSSIIRMQEGTGTTLTRSMKLAILEEEQEWEIRVGEQICSQINQSLNKFTIERKMIFLDHFINGMTLPDVSDKYKMGRRQVYESNKMIRNCLYQSFNLSLRTNEEIYLKAIQKYIETTVNSKIKKACQEQIEISKDIIEWEKNLI